MGTHKFMRKALSNLDQITNLLVLLLLKASFNCVDSIFHFINRKKIFKKNTFKTWLRKNLFSAQTSRLRPSWRVQRSKCTKAGCRTLDSLERPRCFSRSYELPTCRFIRTSEARPREVRSSTAPHVHMFYSSRRERYKNSTFFQNTSDFCI